MTTQLLIYQQVIPVSQEKHLNWSLKRESNYNFAREINSVPLLTAEFAAASVEYPIVFADNQENVMPAIILGIQEQKNLYLTETGEWQAKYIPAFIRRYPFVFSSADDGKTFTLCIDEGFSGWNQEGKGERLFDSQGEHTQYLKNVLNFLQGYQAQFQYTSTFCKKLKELDLFEPMEASFTFGENNKASLGGFMGVTRERLKKLSQNDLFTLMQSDWLELIYSHLYSLNNFSKLSEKIAQP